MKWEPGRRGTGYFKIKLLELKKPAMDMYLIKYPPGSYLPPHTDPLLPEAEHHRINLVVKQPRSGGEFVGDSKFNWRNLFIYFRPDEQEHSLTEVKSGTRIILSIGWLRRNK